MLRTLAAGRGRRMPTVSTSRRCVSNASSSIRRQLPSKLPPDVDPATGLCADGYCRVAPSPGKGFGVFCVKPLWPEHELGIYSGEIYSGTAELHKRYGVNGEIADSDLEWNHQWRAERQKKGIGTTGAYVVKAGSHSKNSNVAAAVAVAIFSSTGFVAAVIAAYTYTAAAAAAATIAATLAATDATAARIIFVDAEDEAVSSWTRYLNHSHKRPNLTMVTSVAEDGSPSVRFVVKQAVQPGDELLFSYGDAYWDFEEPVDDESWDDPRLYHDKDK